MNDEGLTSQELAAIRERAQWSWHTRTSGSESALAFRDREALLNEVDRLRDLLKESDPQRTRCWPEIP